MESSSPLVPEIPAVDLSCEKEEVIEKMKMAATTVGFFQVVNHGVPQCLMEAMLNGARKFHELPEKSDNFRFQRETANGRVIYTTKAAEAANHVNSLIATGLFSSGDLPDIIKDVMMDYSQHMKVLVTYIFELLSIALELKNENLIDMECAKGQSMVLHYYPPADCSTLGISAHADRSFLTILLQDQIGGLQVLHRGRWLNIPPVSGALIVNIGDLLKLISNEKFVSSEHRVWTNKTQARVSVACFYTGDISSTKRYGPLKELLSDADRPMYRETTIKDYLVNSGPCRLDGTSTLLHLKV